MDVIERAKACVELSSFIAGALNGIRNEIIASRYSGYIPSQITSEDAKEILSAFNNCVKLSSNNENEIRRYNFLTGLFKAYFDVTGGRG